MGSILSTVDVGAAVHNRKIGKKVLYSMQGLSLEWNMIEPVFGLAEQGEQTGCVLKWNERNARAHEEVGSKAGTEERVCSQGSIA